MEGRVLKKPRLHPGKQNMIRAKSTSSRPSPRTKVKGALKGMLNMPLDILAEIFRYMMPQDLLNLS
ncbi:hypothetical protein ABKN59_001825 [Abortiporus biennis]